MYSKGTPQPQTITYETFMDNSKDLNVEENPTYEDVVAEVVPTYHDVVVEENPAYQDPTYQTAD